MSALYRDYRPKDFSEVLGQEHIKKTLQNAVAAGNFSHAYLFTGPRGTGKTSVARILARAVNCLHPKNGEPCNKCEICKQFLDGTSLDLAEIDAASNTGVENIREIIEHLKFSPAQAKYKIFIIDEVHMLSKGAFNALLKTLEEPPAHAIFILATTEIYKVPATIISRTQRFDFRRLSSDDLFNHLKSVAKSEKIKIDDSALRLVANAADGGARDALSILDKLSSFGEVDLSEAERLLGITNIFSAQQFLDLLADKKASEALQYLEEIFSAGTDPVQFNKDFLDYLKKVLEISMGAGRAQDLAMDYSKKLQEQAGAISQQRLLHIIRLFLRAHKDLETAPSAELPVEIAAAEACMDNAVQAAAPKPVAEQPVVKSAPPKSPDPVKKNSESKKSALTFRQLSEVWPDILDDIKAQHSYLFPIVNKAKLQAVEDDGTIVLAVDFKFHKASLEDPKHRQIILSAIQDRLDADCGLSVIFVKGAAPQASDADTDVAMKMFGGELI